MDDQHFLWVEGGRGGQRGSGGRGGQRRSGGKGSGEGDDLRDNTYTRIREAGTLPHPPVHPGPKSGPNKLGIIFVQALFGSSLEIGSCVWVGVAWLYDFQV